MAIDFCNNRSGPTPDMLAGIALHGKNHAGKSAAMVGETHILKIMIPQGEGKEACTFGQNWYRDQYLSKNREERGFDMSF